MELSFEIQLQNYKRRISNILESFTDAFFELDSNWVVTYWNKEAERLLLKSREDMIGKNIWEVYAEAIPLKFYTEYHRAVIENIAVRFQEYFEPLKMWIEVAAFPSGEGLSVYFKDITAHKLATEQLQKEKQRYLDLFNLSPLPQWVYDFETLAFLDVNEAAINHYGYTRAEFLQMTINDIRPAEDLDRLRMILSNKISLGNSNRVAVRHCKKNGELIYVTVEGNSVWFEDKEARLVLAIDHTEQIKVEQALVASEKRFKAMVQDGSDLIAIIDMDGKYKYVSPTSLRILGINATELIGKNVFDLMHPDDKKATVKDFQHLKYQKQLQLLPFRFKNAEGEYRWIETIITNMVDDPTIEGMICNSRDITDRIESKIKMEESISRYNIVSKATSDVIWDWNILTGTIIWNKGIQGIFGYDKTIFTREWWRIKIHPDDLDRILTEFELVIKHKKARLQIEYRFRCMDGSYKSVLDRSFVLFDENGEPVRMIGSMQDITERITYLHAIESQNSRLKEIAWIQSHEIRAPLARIMGLIDLLDDFSTSNDKKNCIQHLKTSSQELDAAIRNIMQNIV
ncbi:PAS domain S-box protein [Pedobacter sp. FW305-3-2-15-E-R2A2]|uniref:PAS domain S-box protein n=1 Tax=Pedobacter sp. FW305-3-2-15-E-R2A2 TaxID=3140251 RepID=UPI00313FE398